MGETTGDWRMRMRGTNIDYHLLPFDAKTSLVIGGSVFPG